MVRLFRIPSLSEYCAKIIKNSLSEYCAKIIKNSLSTFKPTDDFHSIPVLVYNIVIDNRSELTWIPAVEGKKN